MGSELTPSHVFCCKCGSRRMWHEGKFDDCPCGVRGELYCVLCGEQHTVVQGKRIVCLSCGADFGHQLVHPIKLVCDPVPSQMKFFDAKIEVIERLIEGYD